MDQMLSYHALWEIVIGTTPKPDPMSNDYKKKNKNVLLLTSSLEDDILSHICGITTAVEVWTKLKNLYETSNELQILLLRNKSTNFKMVASDSITDHVQKLQELKNELSTIDT
jgi:hypothetical protein